MGRNHIHFAIGYSKKDGVISGMRGNCDVYIEINMPKAMAEGLKFYVSANGVILCPGDEEGNLHPKYFRYVYKRTKKDKIILYEAPLDYLVVYDFEAICAKEGNQIYEVQEIIEFPGVIIDLHSKEIKSCFQKYIKPEKYPQISEFCTELTGIT